MRYFITPRVGWSNHIGSPLLTPPTNNFRSARTWLEQHAPPYLACIEQTREECWWMAAAA